MNKVVLSGRLVKDPELRKTSSGNSMVNFSLAVAGDKTPEGRQTYFFDCVCYTQLAEAIVKHLRKGEKITVLGELKQRKYETKDGTMRTTNEVFVREAEFQLKLAEVEEAPVFEDEEPKAKGKKTKGKKTKGKKTEEVDLPDDDLPF